MSSSVERPRIARTDRELATLAMAGDGEAFAELYDRHERRVYGFCLRVLADPDDAADATQETFMRLLARLPALEGRDVNPIAYALTTARNACYDTIAYALTTARNACYDTIAARRRTEPVGEIDGSGSTQSTAGRRSGVQAGSSIARDVADGGRGVGGRGVGGRGVGGRGVEVGAREAGDIAEDPERAALLQSTREQVRAANARLPERQREVLALRELEDMSYEQIGEIVGLNGNAVAQLISRARLRLRDLLRGEALESIAAASPDCERALPLLARRQDAQRAEVAEVEWLQEHMTGCETCRLSQAAMQEAGVSYRALGPIVPLVWLRHTTIARAAELVGVDWSHLAAVGHGAGAGGVSKAGASRLGRRWRAVVLVGMCAILAVALTGKLASDNPAVSPAGSAGAVSTVKAAGNPGDRVLPIGHAHNSTNQGASARVSALAAHPPTPATSSKTAAMGGQAIHPTADRKSGKHVHSAFKHARPVTPTLPGGTTQPVPPPAPTATNPAPSPPASSPSPGSTGTGPGAGETTTTPTTPTIPTETTTTPGTPGSGKSPEETGHGCALAAMC